jgi:nucleotide-binding universal stress UspA family protein
MYKHILIPTDGSSLSANAVEQGIGLAKVLGAKVTGITVSIPFQSATLDPLMVSDTAEQYKQDSEDRAEKFLGTISFLARAAGVQCEVVHVTADPHEGIIDTAISRGCDLIVMASHGHKGVSALVLGSETLTHSKIPVLVCR